MIVVKKEARVTLSSADPLFVGLTLLKRQLLTVLFFQGKMKENNELMMQENKMTRR